LDSADAVIFNNLGALYLSMFLKTKEQGDLGQSIDYFKKAVELDPNLASAHNGLGGAYRMSGNRDEAISSWEKSLELNPNYDFSIYNLAVAYLEKGEKTKALGYLEKYRSLKNNALSPAEKREIETLIERCK
jgi:superkiller protein 3